VILEATSAALVGALAVSTILSLMGIFFPASLISIPPALLISSIASSSAHGEASPNEAIGPVEGLGWPTRMNSGFAAARAGLTNEVKTPVRATVAPATPAFFSNSLRLIVFFSDIIILLFFDQDEILRTFRIGYVLIYQQRCLCQQKKGTLWYSLRRRCEKIGFA